MPNSLQSYASLVIFAGVMAMVTAYAQGPPPLGGICKQTCHGAVDFYTHPAPPGLPTGPLPGKAIFNSQGVCYRTWVIRKSVIETPDGDSVMKSYMDLNVVDTPPCVPTLTIPSAHLWQSSTHPNPTLAGVMQCWPGCD